MVEQEWLPKGIISESLLAYFGFFPTASHPFIWSSLTQPYIKNITNISRYNGNCDFSVSYLWETIFISHLAENMQKGNYSLCHHNKKILVILMLLLFLLEEVKCGLCTWLLVIITIYFLFLICVIFKYLTEKLDYLYIDLFCTCMFLEKYKIQMILSHV